MKRSGVAARFVLVFAMLAWPISAQQPPPLPTPPPTTTTTIRPAPATPAPPPLVLPVDAQRLVDQFTQQQADVQRLANEAIARQRLELIQQLEGLVLFYAANQRPDDAEVVKRQIVLLQKAAGVTPEPQGPPERGDAVIMSAYRDRVGQSFTFTVTGSADRIVWGTGVYTDDTPLEGAAVHAGVLRSGQTGPVRVTVLPGQSRYEGSKRNGVQSGSFAVFQGSYRIDVGQSATRPTSLAGLRGRIGEVLVLPVVGSTSGSVWGSEIYTDDSSLAAAAVHAGAVQAGEFAFVRVTILGGQQQYSSAVRNGVKSEQYGEWQGSFQIQRAPQPWVLRLPDDVEGSGMVSLPTMRNQIGVSFSMQVTGASGTVRGTGLYTDDSSVAAAAVHAGVLKVGEKGYVRITIMPGQQTYAGSEQNGIKSTGAGAWAGSFQIMRGSQVP
jgi:LCCL domain-containing protein